MDCSLPGSSVHGIFQGRVLEWGAIAFSVMRDRAIQLSWNVQVDDRFTASGFMFTLVIHDDYRKYRDKISLIPRDFYYLHCCFLVSKSCLTLLQPHGL